MRIPKSAECIPMPVCMRIATVALATLLGVALLAACGGGKATSPADQEPTGTQDHEHDHGPGGHEGDEGLVLSSETAESVYASARCAPDVPVREYNVAAISLEITLNRFLDYDPQGRMYVLEAELERARKEEAQNRAARADRAEPAASIGLLGDAIQPLTLRVNQGECLRINLRNALDNRESASLHLHGSSLHLASTGAPAIAVNPDAIATPGSTVTYQWMVREGEPEGTHYFHSHGNTREQTSHGLFGALNVEPRGSVYLDPSSGIELQSGWSAIIQDPGGSDFREFAIYYHEIGNEAFTILNKAGGGFALRGRSVPFVDDFGGAYKPGGRAMNYRSEPFMNRMQLQRDTIGSFDLSQAYSSYTFGDPATPIARSYLGDPVKQRLVHGGSEVFHVHHVHGGAIRWRRQPDAEPTAFNTGLDKHPPLLPQVTARIDSQTVGPSENYDVENECGSGGCQQSVGDFLVHCHVAHHYVAGMWMIWRVQNTLQDEVSSLDGLPPLQELPDRRGQMVRAVTSQGLLGKTVDWQGETFQIDQTNLASWVERQLPPPGIPKGYDASVLDWHKEGDLYLNEPDTDLVWPNFSSPVPGSRPPLYFNPKTGKLAYPFLRPHLAKRPPFAPNHGPAPFLDPFRQGTDPPKPGANGPWSLCPADTRLMEFAIHAINLPIALNAEANLLDPVGQLFVLKEQEEAIRADNRLKVPLAIRANAGQDCVDIIFKSELEDTGENGFFSKVNIHIHFVQFDIQGSDGVNTGYNYESSVRPFTVEGETVAVGAASGEFELVLGSAQRFQSGALVGVGMDQGQTFEVRRIRSIEGNTLFFEEPLRHSHSKSEIVSTEFVRYRWYPDVQFGTAYFHDHVTGLTSWRHGLFGALIAEPPGSTYHDPSTGEEARSGPLVDVQTNEKVSVDLSGSFRELVLFVQDDNPLTNVGLSSGSSYNLRVEPLESRAGDPSNLFSSRVHGDPATPLLETFLGDPIRGPRLGVGDQRCPYVARGRTLVPRRTLRSTSPPTNNVRIGISERYDLAIPSAGGPQNLPGDYLYYSGRSFKLREGSWGVLRVHGDESATALRKLPGHESPPDVPVSLCPSDAPVKEFSVFAVEAPLPMLGGAAGKLYVLAEDRDGVLSGALAPEPLVLSVNVGDCLNIRLTNETQSGAVSIHADMLAYDPAVSMGINAGLNPEQTVGVSESRVYNFYAHPEVGVTVALIRDWGNVLENPGFGLYGAIIVGPQGATYSHPETGEDMALKSGWRVDVHPASAPSYRRFALFFQDEDEVIGTHIMPYTEQVQGVLGLNYELEPLAARLAIDSDISRVFDTKIHGSPATPVMEAYVGDPVKVHVLVPFSEQNHVFSLEGHQWPLEPGRAGSDMLNSIQIGGLDAITIELDHGAGGQTGAPGEFLYGDHREPYREAGLWGLFRVYPPGHHGTALRPLPGR